MLVPDTLATTPADSSDTIESSSRTSLRQPIEKGLALQVAAEHGADAGAGDAEGMPCARLATENEGVGEHAADGAGLDVAALGRRPRAALRVPIIEQFAYR